MRDLNLISHLYSLKNKLKIIPIVSTMFVILLILSGCSFFGNSAKATQEETTAVSDENENQSQSNDSANKQEDQLKGEETNGVKDEVLEEQPSSTGETTGTEPTETNLTINVYYVDEQAEYLVGEERVITGSGKEDFIVAAFSEELKSSSQTNLYNLIPKGTKIISAKYEDGYAILNLSKEFVESKGDDGLLDFLIVNCIAATITEIPDIKGVLFEINGKKIDVYGSMDVGIPAKRNEDLIKY
jgi:spore germination protein GerM